MAQKDNDLKRIKELIEIMKQNGLVELEIKHGDDKIFLKRSQPESSAKPMSSQAVPPAPAGGQQTEGTPPAVEQPSKAQPQEELTEIKSPIVGTFYTSPSPDSEPFVEVGSEINSQTVVCIIEAMKVMNEIKAEINGTIAEILVNNGQAVEYGQVLFKVRPD